MQLVLVNSGNTARLAEQAGIEASRVRILHPGTELPGPNPDARCAFRQRHGFGQRPLLLSVGRLTPRKGLAELVEHVLPEVLEAYPQALLLVIGEDARDAVGAGRSSELDRIWQRAIGSGVDAAVRFLPPCDDGALSEAYRAADVHVFPVRELPGDVEGFGMVAIEAAAHGLPTVAFAAGGTSDAVVEGRTGELVSPGNYTAFAASVTRFLANRNDIELRQRCIEAARRFGWDRFAQSLRTMLDDFRKDGHRRRRVRS
jgi:phosphatidyl-myo-inositol dimannoside synthase